jgi:phospholipid/cholesterol/gamma-HCH transport system permease protein
VVFHFLYIVVFHQPDGAFGHYFYSYLKPTDILWALLQAVATAFLIMLVHTYYGFNASGGPAGVGEAVGRAVRAALVVAMVSTLMIGMAVYGASGDFNLSG